MPEEITESAEALHSFQSGEWEIQKNKQRFHTDLAYAARQLYNSHAFILPTEIRNAAQYLTLGGSPNHVPALAMVGFLLESKDGDNALLAVNYMNDGGDVVNAHDASLGVLPPEALTLQHLL